VILLQGFDRHLALSSSDGNFSCCDVIHVTRGRSALRRILGIEKGDAAMTVQLSELPDTAVAFVSEPASTTPRPTCRWVVDATSGRPVAYWVVEVTESQRIVGVDGRRAHVLAWDFSRQES